jgi:hypothetical protein
MPFAGADRRSLAEILLGTKGKSMEVIDRLHGFLCSLGVTIIRRAGINDSVGAKAA